jgi:hypothetical protein
VRARGEIQTKGGEAGEDGRRKASCRSYQVISFAASIPIHQGAWLLGRHGIRTDSSGQKWLCF